MDVCVCSLRTLWRSLWVALSLALTGCLWTHTYTHTHRRTCRCITAANHQTFVCNFCACFMCVLLTSFCNGIKNTHTHTPNQKIIAACHHSYGQSSHTKKKSSAAALKDILIQRCRQCVLPAHLVAIAARSRCGTAHTHTHTHTYTYTHGRWMQIDGYLSICGWMDGWMDGKTPAHLVSSRRMNGAPWPKMMMH